MGVIPALHCRVKRMHERNIFEMISDMSLYMIDLTFETLVELPVKENSSCSIPLFICVFNYVQFLADHL